MTARPGDGAHVEPNAGLRPRRSEYYDMSADEVFRRYWGWYRRIRALYLALSALIGLAAIVSFVLGSVLLYAVGLAAIVALALVLQTKINRRFVRLVAILDTDCDVQKWRSVINLLRTHLRRKRSLRTCKLYLAVADFEECRPADALARMAGLRISAWNPQAVSLHQGRAVNANELGDTATRDAELAALRELCSRGLPAARAIARDQVESLELIFRPRDSWGEKDLALIEAHLAKAASHRECVSWELHLAEYHLLHGDAVAAAQLLGEGRLAPMTPRARRRRDELARQLRRLAG
ncbi:hypothetical protein [Olsenella profusa]|uniref:Uncharacterized protein n=1 Tax=Olsenella profusa TaxID=138595 RepID=A0ABS2F088_9ACTN|nr:hypothetical protein [Olsenella profusa]MBM6774391.1 hypothetical protein [Olsenella profusa]